MYSLCCRLCVSSFVSFPVFPVSCFLIRSLIFTPISLLYTLKSRVTLISTWNTFFVREWGGGGGPMGDVEASLALYVFLIGRSV